MTPFFRNLVGFGSKCGAGQRLSFGALGDPGPLGEHVGTLTVDVDLDVDSEYYICSVHINFMQEVITA